MKHYDAVVIGGGVLGCFAARSLRRWNISTLLAEAEADVCTGISKANTAIVYAGYDNKVGSLKAQMTVRGNTEFEKLCEDLDVPFSRYGSLMVSYGPGADRVLKKKYENGCQSGVPGLRLISGQEAEKMEPMLAPGVSSALYAPSTGTVNPWQLTIAAYENAIHNGCDAIFNSPVRAIEKAPEGYILTAGAETICCKAVLNCAGLQADRVQELCFEPSVRISPDGADFLILDEQAPKPRCIIFQESEEKGKGVTAVPTVDGNLLLGPSQRPLEGEFWATSRTGLDFLRKGAMQVLPNLDLTQVIRTFGSVRPNPHRVVPENGAYVPDGRSIGSFSIENPAPGFYSLIGIKTPGLTCADQLGRYLAEGTAAYLNAAENPDFYPIRNKISKKDHQIICQCRNITKGEILEAIRRGATTLDGIKRRVGSGLGRCQGSRCSWEIERILEDAKHGTL